MTTDFIFCPLCGASKWLSNKTLGEARGRLTEYKCSGCKKFIYTNIQMLVEHPILVGITHTVRYSVDATVKDYRVKVQYLDKYTEFLEADSQRVILRLERPVTFNWYKDEDLVEKIKKYLLFS